tara:strand:+ start:4101 stop:4241 length:141 start_codon:yes stop_codon:yes gene_type:complete
MEFQFDLLSFAIGLAVLPLLHMAAYGTGYAFGYVQTRRFCLAFSGS